MTMHIDFIIQGGAGSDDWDKVAHAIQTQIRYDVAQSWHVGNDATVSVRPKPLATHWPIYVVGGDSDVSGALGYHETDPNDPTKAIGKVFPDTDRKYGLSPTVTASHEAIEIVGDFLALSCVQCNPKAPQEFWAQELGDPVESDADGYELEGIQLSNFVTPAYFVGPPTGGNYDYRGLLKTPRTLRPGGYQAFWNGRTWTQRTAQSAPGVTSRALTMGRNKTRAALVQWAEALAVES